jgi:hypothetical protein
MKMELFKLRSALIQISRSNLSMWQRSLWPCNFFLGSLVVIFHSLVHASLDQISLCDKGVCRSAIVGIMK